jgi:hypothetical protein
LFANESLIFYNEAMGQKKEVKEEFEWDKKKVILFMITGVLILLAIVYEFRPSILSKTATISNSVKGASTLSNPLPDIKTTVQNQINNLKTEAQDINVVDIATSSPQVQKVINDLKAIQDYPKNQLKQTCEKICSGL